MANRSARTSAYGVVCLLVTAGCGSPGMEHGETRTAAYAAYRDALTAYSSKDYASAEPKLTSAIDSKTLNPDVYCEAVAKRAVCWAAAGKYAEAIADLDNLGPAAPNQDEMLIARSYILRKQGKAAESRTALARARQLNRTIPEIKD